MVFFIDCSPPTDGLQLSRFTPSLDDRQKIDELTGLCRGFCADGDISHLEAEYLHKWLVANQGVTNNPSDRNALPQN